MKRMAGLPPELSRRWRTGVAAVGLALAAALVAGCASYNGSNLIAGRSTAAEVESSMGAPAEKHTEANGDAIWFYPRGPSGRQTFAVRIGQDGVVRGVEQRLTSANVAALTADKSTAQEARAVLGPPNFNRYFPRTKRYNWEYAMTEGEGDNQYSTSNFKRLTLEFSEDSVLRRVTLQDDFNDLAPGCTLC